MREALSALAYCLVALAIAVSLEMIGFRHNLRLDLTPHAEQSLSPRTKRVLRSLKRPVEVTVFYERGKRLELREDLLRYRYESPRFRFRLIDLDKHPGLARQHRITAYGQTVVACGRRRVVINYPSEEQLVNAILKVTNPRQPVVYFLSGHGEKDPEDDDEKRGYSGICDSLETENYAVKGLRLFGGRPVPEDASVVVVAGPERPLLPEELRSLGRYLDRGGRLLAMVDPGADVPGLRRWLASYGVVLREDIVVDKKNHPAGGDELTPVIPLYRDHPITRGFRLATVFPLVRSVRLNYEVKGPVDQQTLALSTPQSWAERDLRAALSGRARFDGGVDEKGPIPVAVALQLRLEKGQREGRLVVFGDSDFVTNAWLNRLGNRDLFMNAVNWLRGEETLIAVRPRRRKYDYRMLQPYEGRRLFWSAVVAEPGLLLALGLFVWARRQLGG